MKSAKFLCALVITAATVFVHAAVPQGATIKVGVYGCRMQSGMEAIPLQFGIIDGKTYSNYDGGRGTYAWNAAEQKITFTTGPFKGLWRKWVDGTFRIWQDGQLTGMDCPYTPKDPKKLHWLEQAPEAGSC